MVDSFVCHALYATHTQPDGDAAAHRPTPPAKTHDGPVPRSLSDLSRRRTVNSSNRPSSYLYNQLTDTLNLDPDAVCSPQERLRLWQRLTAVPALHPNVHQAAAGVA